MAEWEYVNEIKVIRCGTSIEREQKEALGYGGRTIETLRCSKCHKVTFVDNSIRYDYCPHCGAKMKQYWEPQYPTWGEWLMSISVISGLFPKGAIDALGNLKQPIPADMAEKLGIEPKEG